MSYRELFYPCILRRLNLPTVKNDLAKRKEITGIISEDYTIDKVGIENIYNIMKNYFNQNFYKPFYNVEDLKTLLKWHCIQNHYIYNEETERELIERFIIQILLGNSDLKPANLETYIENSVLHFSPFYDFGWYGTIRMSDDKKNKYKLQYQQFPFDKDGIPAEVTIENFLNNGNQAEIILFKEYLEKIKEIRLQEVFTEIKDKTEYNVPQGIKRVLTLEVENNIQNVDTIVKGNFHC